jgi:hypothetical protein
MKIALQTAGPILAAAFEPGVGGMQLLAEAALKRGCSRDWLRNL